LENPWFKFGLSDPGEVHHMDQARGPKIGRKTENLAASFDENLLKISLTLIINIKSWSEKNLINPDYKHSMMVKKT